MQVCKILFYTCSTCGIDSYLYMQVCKILFYTCSTCGIDSYLNFAHASMQDFISYLFKKLIQYVELTATFMCKCARFCLSLFFHFTVGSMLSQRLLLQLIESSIFLFNRCSTKTSCPASTSSRTWGRRLRP